MNNAFVLSAEDLKRLESIRARMNPEYTIEQTLHETIRIMEEGYYPEPKIKLNLWQGLKPAKIVNIKRGRATYVDVEEK